MKALSTPELQNRLAQYCRTGVLPDLPGLTPGRLPHYRRLILNVIVDNLESAFPIARANIGESDWTVMTEEFFRDHPCQAWQVWAIAGEFVLYARHAGLAERFDLPWLSDLLEMEWQEMLVYNMPDGRVGEYVDLTDPLNQCLVLHPDLRLLQLHYPVHLYSPPEALHKPGQYILLVYRDPVTLKVQFMDLALWPALLLEQLKDGALTLAALLPEAELFFPQLSFAQLQAAAFDFFEQLRHRGILLGAMPQFIQTNT